MRKKPLGRRPPRTSKAKNGDDEHLVVDDVEVISALCRWFCEGNTAKQMADLANEHAAHLRADPEELESLAARETETAAGLEAELRRMLAAGRVTHAPGELSEETLERLRALGYVE